MSYLYDNPDKSTETFQLYAINFDRSLADIVNECDSVDLFKQESGFTRLDSLGNGESAYCKGGFVAIVPFETKYLHDGILASVSYKRPHHCEFYYNEETKVMTLWGKPKAKALLLRTLREFATKMEQLEFAYSELENAAKILSISSVMAKSFEKDRDIKEIQLKGNVTDIAQYSPSNEYHVTQISGEMQLDEYLPEVKVSLKDNGSIKLTFGKHAIFALEMVEFIYRQITNT